MRIGHIMSLQVFLLSMLSVRGMEVETILQNYEPPKIPQPNYQPSKIPQPNLDTVVEMSETKNTELPSNLPKKTLLPFIENQNTQESSVEVSCCLQSEIYCHECFSVLYGCGSSSATCLNIGLGMAGITTFSAGLITHNPVLINVSGLINPILWGLSIAQVSCEKGSLSEYEKELSLRIDTHKQEEENLKTLQKKLFLKKMKKRQSNSKEETLSPVPTFEMFYEEKNDSPIETRIPKMIHNPIRKPKNIGKQQSCVRQKEIECHDGCSTLYSCASSFAPAANMLVGLTGIITFGAGLILHNPIISSVSATMNPVLWALTIAQIGCEKAAQSESKTKISLVNLDIERTKENIGVVQKTLQRKKLKKMQNRN